MGLGDWEENHRQASQQAGEITARLPLCPNCDHGAWLRLFLVALALLGNTSALRGHHTHRKAFP